LIIINQKKFTIHSQKKRKEINHFHSIAALEEIVAINAYFLI